MNDVNISIGGAPTKTVWTVVWIGVLGLTVLVLNYVLLNQVPPILLKSPRPESSFAEPMAALPPTQLGPELDEEEELDVEIKAAKPGEPPSPPHQAIEDPNRSMCGFYKALRAVDKEASSSEVTPVRILHYGDSILTTDQLSDRVRNHLQRRFGDGGHGFVLLGKPWRWYHHLGVSHGANRKWTPRPISSAPVRDGIFGLGGVAFETDRANATAWAGTPEEGEEGRIIAGYDISYLSQPGGGSFDVFINDVLKETVSTRAEGRRASHQLVKAPTGESRLTVKTRGDGPVRVFGAVLESGSKGVVYDSLAINGARIGLFSRYDEHHWTDEMRHRNANLVIMMCGANEGNNDELALGIYKEQLGSVLTTIRNAVPHAGCLMVGPLDQAVRGEDGALTSKRMPRKLTNVQRQVAVKHGCAFFDTYQAMGGKDSMAKWYRRGLAGADFIHPTEQGARKIGNWLAEALLAGYDNYLYNGEQCESSVTSL